MIAADRAALSIYRQYENTSPELAQNYAVHVYNFFATRLGNRRDLPPDRRQSLLVFQNRNPRLVGGGINAIKNEADVVAKSYNTNECLQANQGPCDLLTDEEMATIRRLNRIISVKDFLRRDPDESARMAARSVRQASSQLASKVGETLKNMGEATGHVIQCEVSPPNYDHCVTADGVTYIRSSNQAIQNIRDHVNKTQGSRSTFNQQRRSQAN